MADQALRQKITRALSEFAGETPLREGAKNLLNALGYASNRTEEGSVLDFLISLIYEKGLTDRQNKLFDAFSNVEIVFQFTDDEITSEDLPSDDPGFENERVESFLFLAVDMHPRTYSRTDLADTTRTINLLFSMPAIVLFRHGTTLTLATIHRRRNKHDEDRDVLEKVTLIKDVHFSKPHRAHINILVELSIKKMIDAKVRNFDDLHKKWEQVLDIKNLNKHFYDKLFRWFERAVEECTFPNDGVGNGSNEQHVIRLITRLLFIWFLKEKDLVPEKLFEEDFARLTLKDYAPDRTDYYRVVLQNLFFATLNTEINERSFGNRDDPEHLKLSKYLYRDLLRDPDSFFKEFEKVPFVNGGLFDCLDNFAGTNADHKLVDVFTDDPVLWENLCVPAYLFLDSRDGLFAIFHQYKFTIEESTPLDQEVALDPELLGRVFENLLAAYNPETQQTARKATGSYYTPPPVVDYMVRKTLVKALASIGKPADSDIASWHEKLEHLLDHSDPMDDASQHFKEAERQTAVRNIAEIRALDPAVGSGAFPMAILQTLTLALRRLDPNNELWEEVQKECARKKTKKAFETSDRASRDNVLKEISSTFENYRQSDYGRKLYLIQNCIYGVDIQPIACQIAKLRFFISLIIEQTPNPNMSNIGIQPLPNLDTRLLTADSLLKLEQSAQMGLEETDDALKLKQELRNNRERYFHARGRAEKLKIQGEDKRLRTELTEYLRKAGFSTRDIECIANWDPYDQNAIAQWFDPKYMFDIDVKSRDGFDIVIGNPPYIQLQKDGGQIGKRYQAQGYLTFQRTGDIYQIFYERGCELLKPQTGILAYITSNKWMRAAYGEKLRRFFLKKNPLMLVDLGSGVFTATVDTNILLLQNADNQNVLQAVTCDITDIREKVGKESITLGKLTTDAWFIGSDAEINLKEKIERIGTPLKDWDISIYRGILTGYNDAFIVNTATREHLIAEDSASKEILKPVFRGRDIERYRANWADLWVIYTHNGYRNVSPIDVDDYPAVKAHLDSDRFIKRLEHRQDKGVTPYNLRSCAYHEEFMRDKIVWSDISTSPTFQFLAGECYLNNTAYMIVGSHLKYMAGTLNSSLIKYYFPLISTGLGATGSRYFKVFVEKIPIPRITKKNKNQADKIIDLVEDIIAVKATNSVADTREQEAEIDRSVYSLYDLNEVEISLVEKI